MIQRITMTCIVAAVLALPALAADEHGAASHAPAATHSTATEAAHGAAAATHDAAAAHEDHAEHGGGGGSLLSPDLGTAVWTIVLFLVLLAILGKFAWPNILKGLQDRERKILTDLEAAQKAAADAQRTLEEYKAQLAKAQEEAARIIDAGKRNAEKLAAQIQDDTRTEIDEMRKRTAGEIKFAKETALSEIYTQAANLSANLAGQILQREIKPENHRDLVTRALERVKA